MKKLIALALVVISLLALSAFALADGELQLVEENYSVFEGKDNKYTAFVFCVFENTSDTTVEVKKCEINVTDAAGTPFLEKSASASTSDFHPSVVHPGERTYLRKDITCKDVTDASLISRYTMTMETRAANGENVYAESEPVYEFKLNSKGDSMMSIIAAKITNVSDAEHDGLNMLIVIHDQNGKLIYANCDNSGRLTLFPGSTIQYVVSGVAGDLTKVWLANGVEPTTVESICWFAVK